MDLLQFRYFDVIARYENISRAAEELRVSQPSLSSSLTRLERELGYRLFDRRGKKIYLNEQGRQFWKNTKQILQLIAESRLPPPSGEKDGKISIAFQNYNDDFFRTVCEFRQNYPKVRFYLYQSSLSETFAVNTFDFLLSTTQHTFPCKMESLLLGSKKWFAVVPQHSEWTSFSELPVEYLRDQNFCFLQDRNGNMEDSYRICLENRFIPHSVITTNSPMLKRQILEQGDLYGFIPSGWYNAYKDIRTIRLIPLSVESEAVEIRLYWSDGASHSPAAEAFLSFCRRKNLSAGQ